jgi:predicted nucleic acid-binding Zn finger protein
MNKKEKEEIATLIASGIEVDLDSATPAINKKHSTTRTREEKGLAIYLNSGVEHLGDDLYLVKSDSNSDEYVVEGTEGFETCECPDFAYRNAICKHIWAVRFYIKNGEYEEYKDGGDEEELQKQKELERQEAEINEFMDY